MRTGSLGTFVFSWSQTETDGQPAAPMDLVVTGAAWRWTGEAIRVDRPGGMLVLEGAEGADEMRARASRMVRRLIGAAIFSGEDRTAEAAAGGPLEDLPDQSIAVTDGWRLYTLTVIEVPDTRARLLMAVGELPPREQDLWIVRTSFGRRPPAPRPARPGGVICFAPGTFLATPQGQQRIDTLRPGDKLLTRDNGAEEVLWLGHRRMSGARLHAMPELRPIRFRAGALGMDEPDRDLIVSPQHRMLIRGTHAQALFNGDEVLVEARALINDQTILVDYSMREMTYIHVMLARHNVIWANGLQTESFHPANTAFEAIAPEQRDGLSALLPGVKDDPWAYGEHARRNLTASEAAILRYDMGA